MFCNPLKHHNPHQHMHYTDTDRPLGYTTDSNCFDDLYTQYIRVIQVNCNCNWNGKI